MQIRTVADLAAGVRQARQRRRITQAQLAKQAGVSRHWIVSLESGQAARAELGRVLAVLAALDLPLALPSADPVPPGPEDHDDFDLDAHLASFRASGPPP